MTRKSKLVLKTARSTDGNPPEFEIVKAVNTLAYGVPGDHLSRKEVDSLLSNSNAKLRQGDFVIEFIKGGN